MKKIIKNNRNSKNKLEFNNLTFRLKAIRTILGSTTTIKLNHF